MPRVFIVEDETMKVIRAYRCPSDVEQLCKTIDGTVARGGGQPIGLEDLLQVLLPVMSLIEAEKVLVRRALKNHPANFGEAAKTLGISRTTLWRRMKVYGIEPERKPGLGQKTPREPHYEPLDRLSEEELQELERP